MRLEDLDYDRDPALIAQVPIEPRYSARLLVDRGQSAPEHRHVTDLPEPGDLLVVNETTPMRNPARTIAWSSASSTVVTDSFTCARPPSTG